MADEILISIVMPAYNSEATIRNSIESVFSQTYRLWELIIIDDGSSDNTNCIIREIQKEDLRVCVVLNSVNLGVCAARNKGILTARGDWIAFLDSDDIWLPDKLEKQVNLLRLNCSIDLVYTGSFFINENGIPFKYFFTVPEEISYKELLKQNVISCSSVLVRKNLVTRYKMKYDDMHEDFAVWLQILKSGGSAKGINEPLLFYRISPKSKSGSKKRAALMTLKVYKFIGLNIFQSIYYFSKYLLNSIKKYYFISKF